MLTSRHIVANRGYLLLWNGRLISTNGCLEGVFAFGQVYVLISRVTDPRNMCLLGLDERDLILICAL